MLVDGARHPTILIVEDDESTRELYQAVLRAEGFNVRTVADGIDALRPIDADQPSLILLDLTLPRPVDLDALVATVRLRLHAPETRDVK